MYCDTIDEIVIGLTPFTVYSLITTVNNTAEKRANLPSHIMKTTLLLQTPTPTQQDNSKMAVSVKSYQFNGHFNRKSLKRTLNIHVENIQQFYIALKVLILLCQRFFMLRRDIIFF